MAEKIKLKFKAGSRVTLYNIETGAEQAFHPVDAKACLARGGWSLEAPNVAVDTEPDDSELIAQATEGPDAGPEDPEPIIDEIPDGQGEGKEALIEKASDRGLGAPSTLKRWSIERLEREIEAQEAE